MRTRREGFLVAALACGALLGSGSVAAAPAADAALAAKVDAALGALQPRIIGWRRDLHQNPELSNREFRTSKLVAEHLKRLGMAVETGIAFTGVIGVLKGGLPGPTVVLRADMDGLPVTEQTDVPFRSRVTTDYRGQTVGVMHACGHDTHVAILMGLAEAFAGVRAELPGTIVFLFQPAEEGAPEGEEGGAELMLKQGVFEKYRPSASFALHVTSNLRAGEIGYRGGPLMAAVDSYRIRVQGRQTHGARPWGGVDPIVTSAQIVTALQTIVSRNVDITANPAVVTVGAIRGGIRENIIPDEVEMIGTIRTFDTLQRAEIHARIRSIAENIAESAGATASFEIRPGSYPVLNNDVDLTRRVVPVLERVAGADKVKAIPLTTGAEDFAFFAQAVPSFFFFVGVTPPDQNPVTAPSNHSPLFYVDEAGLPVGARAFAAVALEYLSTGTR
jgi:amidohydrolase